MCYLPKDLEPLFDNSVPWNISSKYSYIYLKYINPCAYNPNMTPEKWVEDITQEIRERIYMNKEFMSFVSGEQGNNPIDKIDFKVLFQNAIRYYQNRNGSVSKDIREAINLLQDLLWENGSDRIQYI